MNSIEQQKTQVDKYIAELNAHRWDDAVAAFEGDAPLFENVPSNMRLTGWSGISSGIEVFATALPDMQLRILHAADAPGYSIREVIVTGTHEGTYQGMEATGKRIHFACACVFEFDTARRLRTERLYFDNETLQQQMQGRVLPYLPSTLRIAA